MVCGSQGAVTSAAITFFTVFKCHTVEPASSGPLGGARIPARSRGVAIRSPAPSVTSWWRAGWLWAWEGPGQTNPGGRGSIPTPTCRLLLLHLSREAVCDLGLQPTGRIEATVRMVLLGLLQSGGWVFGQAMEQVTGGNLLSTLLIACAFTLSIVYLFRLAVGHMVQLPAGAVRAPQGSSVCAPAKRAGSGALAVAGARGAGVAAADASAAGHPDLCCCGGLSGVLAGI